MNIYMICTILTPFQAERDWKNSYRYSLNSPLIYILFSMFIPLRSILYVLHLCIWFPVLCRELFSNNFQLLYITHHPVYIMIIKNKNKNNNNNKFIFSAYIVYNILTEIILHLLTPRGSASNSCSAKNCLVTYI